jgi:hypothetical protein
MAKHTLNLVTAGAEALFASGLDPSARPTATQVRRAVSTTLRRLGGVAACAEVMAEQFGEHPETAAPRMDWAHNTMRQLARTA